MTQGAAPLEQAEVERADIDSRPHCADSGAQQGPATAESSYAAPYAWALVATLFFVQAVATFDRQIVTLLVESMRRDLGITDEQAGVIIGLSFAIAYAICVIPVGYLADRWSRKKLLMLGLSFWSVMTALSGLAKSAFMLGVARVGVGAGESVAGPTAIPMIADAFPAERRSFPIALCLAGPTLGVVAALSGGGLILSHLEELPAVDLPVIGTLFPWQALLPIAGALGLLLLVPLMLLPEPRGAAVSISPDARGSGALAFMRPRWRAYLAICLGSALFGVATFGVLGWAPTALARTHGMSSRELGMSLGAVTLIAGLFGPVLGGFVANRAVRIRPFGSDLRGEMLLIFIAGAIYIGAMFAPTPMTCVILLGVGLLFSDAIFSIPMIALMNMTPPQFRSVATSISTLAVTCVGLGLGPAIVGFMSTRVFGEGQLALSIAATVLGVTPLAILVLLFGLRSYREQLEWMLGERRDVTAQ